MGEDELGERLGLMLLVNELMGGSVGTADEEDGEGEFQRVGVSSE